MAPSFELFARPILQQFWEHLCRLHVTKRSPWNHLWGNICELLRIYECGRGPGGGGQRLNGSDSWLKCVPPPRNVCEGKKENTHWPSLIADCNQRNKTADTQMKPQTGLYPGLRDKRFHSHGGKSGGARFTTILHAPLRKYPDLSYAFLCRVRANAPLASPVT